MTYETNGFRIVVPVKADAAGIGVAHLQAWHETYPNVELGITDAWIDEQFGFLGAQAGTEFREGQIATANKPGSDTLYLVVKNAVDKVVGFMHATRSEPVAKLDAIYLIREAQGSGIARELIERALSFIGQLPTEVEVANYNDRAIHFYEKYDFVRVPDSEIMHREKIPIFTMLRPVKEVTR